MCNKPHKHAALIKQWADGAEIEYRVLEAKDWIDTRNPAWFIDAEYRVKPVTRKYRVALIGRGDARASHDEISAAMLEQHPYFVRWLTDWIEYEI